MAQTAVQWLLEVKKKWGNILLTDLEQAKAMEKEQMIDFAKNMPMEIGNDDEGNSFVRYNPLEYYNKTYNNGL